MDLCHAGVEGCDGIEGRGSFATILVHVTRINNTISSIINPRRSSFLFKKKKRYWIIRIIVRIIDQQKKKGNMLNLIDIGQLEQTHFQTLEKIWEDHTSNDPCRTLMQFLKKI